MVPTIRWPGSSWRSSVTFLLLVESVALLFLLWRSPTTSCPTLAHAPRSLPSKPHGPPTSAMKDFKVPATNAQTIPHAIRIVAFDPDVKSNKAQLILQKANVVPTGSSKLSSQKDSEPNAAVVHVRTSPKMYSWVSGGYLQANTTSHLSTHQVSQLLGHITLWERLAYGTDGPQTHFIVLETNLSVTSNYFTAIHTLVPSLPNGWEACFLPTPETTAASLTAVAARLGSGQSTTVGLDFSCSFEVVHPLTPLPFLSLSPLPLSHGSCIVRTHAYMRMSG